MGTGVDVKGMEMMTIGEAGHHTLQIEVLKEAKKMFDDKGYKSLKDLRNELRSLIEHWNIPIDSLSVLYSNESLDDEVDPSVTETFLSCWTEEIEELKSNIQQSLLSTNFSSAECTLSANDKRIAIEKVLLDNAQLKIASNEGDGGTLSIDSIRQLEQEVEELKASLQRWEVRRLPLSRLVEINKKRSRAEISPKGPEPNVGMQATDKKGDEACAAQHNSGNVKSPGRKITRRGGVDVILKAVIIEKDSLLKINAAQLHCISPSTQDRRYSFTGRIVSADGVVRTLKLTKRGSGSKKESRADEDDDKEDRDIFGLTIEDHVGPVQIVAWGNKARELMTIVEQMENMQEDDTTKDFGLKLEVFALSGMKESRPALCVINMINTTDSPQSTSTGGTNATPIPENTIDLSGGTQFSIVEMAEYQEPVSLALRTNPSVAGITSLESLRNQKPRYRVNIAGTIAEITPTQASMTSGKPLRTFQLSDGRGNFVVVKQHGAGSEDEELKVNAQIIIFYVLALPGKSSGQNGSLWAFADAYVKICGSAGILFARPSKEIVIPPE